MGDLSHITVAFRTSSHPSSTPTAYTGHGVAIQGYLEEGATGCRGVTLVSSLCLRRVRSSTSWKVLPDYCG